jgi:hypothetical protein
MPRNRNKTYAEQRISRIRRYGIDVEDYERMLEEQNGACFICGKQPENNRALDIDHNHSTGKVRGLLCSNHNRALGLMGDDVVLLLKSIEYLVKSNG